MALLKVTFTLRLSGFHLNGTPECVISRSALEPLQAHSSLPSLIPFQFPDVSQFLTPELTDEKKRLRGKTVKSLKTYVPFGSWKAVALLPTRVRFAPQFWPRAVPPLHSLWSRTRSLVPCWVSEVRQLVLTKTRRGRGSSRVSVSTEICLTGGVSQTP